jgi:hypothetical protein
MTTGEVTHMKKHYRVCNAMTASLLILKSKKPNCATEVTC